MGRRRRNRPYFTQRGLALIAVSVSLVMLGAVTAEFSTNTTTDHMAATNAVNSMRTHFHNRSGANLAQLVIRVQTDVLDRYRKQLGDIQLSDYIGLFMPAFGGSTEDAKAMAQMVGGFEADKIEGLGVEVGTFDIQITTEDGKINLNCANGSQQTKETLQTQLEAMLYFDAYDPIFEEETGDGWRRTRSEQVSALIDYVDRDSSRFGQPGTRERYGYENLDDDYEPKNNYLDTTDEIKLVRGVDERFWTLFGSEFTVYGDCKLNIGAVKDTKTVASIIFLAAKNPDDPVLADPSGKKLFALAQRVVEARQLGVFFDDLQAFADFVKSPDGALGDLFGQQGQQGTPAASAAASIAQGYEPVEGVELDMNKLQQVAKAGPRRLYRVEVTSQVGQVQSRLVAIWDTSTQNQNARKPQEYGRGAWVYWREE